MGSLINVFIFTAAVLTTVLGQNYSINRVTNGTEDYMKIAQAELLFKTKISEMKNDAVDARFLERLAVIKLQQKLVLNETQQVNQTLIPLQALNLVRKYCIQTYDSQFITHTNAEEQYKNCMLRAESLVSGLTSSAKLYTKNAKTEAAFNLPDSVYKWCKWNNYKNNQTLVEKCYIDYVNQSWEVVQSNLDKAQAMRELSIADMNNVSLLAAQCSFDVTKVVLETIALTSKKINDCVDDLQKRTAPGHKNALN